jgi:alkylation response protein AidB-like acyl-CoA dehydrogenase
LKIAREWAVERQQWGGPIGKHEAVASKLGWMASHLFAMESMTWLTSAWVDQGKLDIRIEAAMAKLFSTEAAWTIVDETLQIRGGRGYETAQSLKGRGEAAIPVERIFRDARINRIIEGTSEIMRLFLAREALDPHIRLAFDVILPGHPPLHRIKAGLRAALFYAFWYPKQWLPVLGCGARPAGLPRPLHRHWVAVQRLSRQLARTLFHQMIRHQQKLEKRQMVLFRLVDAGVDLFAMSAALSRAALLSSEKPEAADLADLFCTYARSRIAVNLRRPNRPEDRRNDRVSQKLLKGGYAWLEEGIVKPLDESAPGLRR